MSINPVKIRKRFIALKDCQIGTGFSFLKLTEGQSYETDFVSVDHYNSLVGMKMIEENRGNKIKTEAEKEALKNKIVLQSPVNTHQPISPEITKLAERIANTKSIKALNNIISRLNPSELNAAVIQNAIVAVQTSIQNSNKELVNG